MSAAGRTGSFEAQLWVRLFLLFNLGPLPLGILLVTDALHDGWEGAICATWGALIGLTVGLLRTSLLRAIAGINVGAAAGMAWWNFVDANNANDLMACFALAFAGAMLGM